MEKQLHRLTFDFSDDNNIVLAQYIVSLFQEIFNNPLLFNEECRVYINLKIPYPQFETNYNPPQIRLCVEDGCWCQFTFQFAHELMHYVIRQRKKEKEKIISWFEEIIAEAMSLYILKKLSENWLQCDLSEKNSEYAVFIAEYYKNELTCNEGVVERLSDCDNIEQLSIINDISESKRASHQEERNKLFNLFVQNEQYITIIVNYANYINPDALTINFMAWSENLNVHERKLLNDIKALQPI